MTFKVPPPPRRALCCLDDEPNASWFISTDGRSFTRVGGDWATVTQERLLLVASGFNDAGYMLPNGWPLHLQARFQPHRNLDGT